MNSKDSVDIAVALTERLLREQQMIFDRAATGILFTRDRRIQRCNPAFEAIFGWEHNQMQGQPTRVMYASDQAWAENGALVYPALSAHGRFDGELCYSNHRGEPIWCRVTASWVHADNPDEGAVWLMEDVTLARAASIALQESEARFVRLFDQSPMPMGYSSSSDDFSSTVWNDAWFETFGFDRAMAQGQSGLTLGLWVNPQERVHRLDRALRGEAIHNEEAQLQRADGAIRWVSLSSRSFVEATRTLVVFTYFDITERRLAQEEVLALNTQLEARVAQRTAELLLVNQELTHALATLELARDQLVQSEKLAALGSLVTGVAHELNTPIGNCVTAVSALDYRVAELAQLADAGLKRSDLQSFLDDSRQATDLMGRNITRAATLITSFKQVAVDQTSSQRRQFSLDTAIAEILLTLKPIVAKSACTLTSDTPQDAELDSFPGPLGQVLTHLIENAILHGYDKGQTAGPIAVETRRVDAGHIAITVRDTGRGIPAEHMLHLFEPFFTTRLGQGGSGLGLYVVHNIATGVLGGTVAVSSVEDQGAAFTITIPLVAPACKRLLDRVTHSRSSTKGSAIDALMQARK